MYFCPAVVGRELFPGAGFQGCRGRNILKSLWVWMETQVTLCWVGQEMLRLCLPGFLPRVPSQVGRQHLRVVCPLAAALPEPAAGGERGAVSRSWHSGKKMAEITLP